MFDLRHLLRLVILGGSVSLIMRPPRQHREQGTYPELVEQRLWAAGRPVLVINEATRAGIVSEAILNIHKMVTRHAPDIVVLHYGINEVVPRLWPRWLHLFLNEPRPLLAGFPAVLLGNFNRAINGLVAPMAIKLLSLRPWYSPQRFCSEMTLLLKMIEKETVALIYVVNIAPTTGRIEHRLPGASMKIHEYNEVLATTATKSHAHLIDLYSRLAGEDMENVVADGIHLTANGHKILAEMLVEQILLDLHVGGFSWSR